MVITGIIVIAFKDLDPTILVDDSGASESDDRPSGLC
jgi:hypothetical protein